MKKKTINCKQKLICFVDSNNILNFTNTCGYINITLQVIVMELCTGGSLFNLLDDPENSYGLDEDEFLLVLSHLSAGMNHLRDNNLVHRDLKPGNIMKFIKVILKLLS